VSLCDLLPTFNGLALGADWENPVEPLEGTDLTKLLNRGNPASSRTIHAEYLAESAESPIFMIRRGSYKYIYSSSDPGLLYNLDEDPDELKNLAVDVSQADLIAELGSYIATKWDQGKLTRDILLSQRRRRLILQANSNGAAPRWNHGESPGEKVIWYRGDGSYNDWAFTYLPPLHTIQGQ
jgi:choline-sulfatase